MDTFEKLTQYMDHFLEMGVPGYACVVWQDGKCVYRHENGYSDLEHRIPMNGKERVNLYSCSKPFTCTAAMQLWEQGAFSLEDELYRYLPEFREMTVRTADGLRAAEKPILIKHLFEMTAGLNYNVSSPSLMALRKDTDGLCPTREAMRYLAREPLDFEPGASWQYSLCHDVLAALVEELSGMPFETYEKKNIFDRLGMSHSTFRLPPEELGTIACQYQFDEQSGKVVNVGPEIRNYKLGALYASGGAGAISTADDYMLFLEAMRQGETLLKRSTIQRMATDRLNETQTAAYNTHVFWLTHGYGLGMRCPKNGSPCTDFGWDGAAGSYMAIDPEYGLTFFYTQHMLDSPNHYIRPNLYRILRGLPLV